MSSTRSAPTLNIEPRPDVWLAAWLGLVHAAVAAVAWLLPLHTAVRISWVTACAASTFLGFRRHLLRQGPGAVAAVHWNRTGEWTVRDGAGLEQRAELVSTVTLNWLILIEFRMTSGRGSRLVLGPRSLPPEVFRRLTVRLRLQRFAA